MVGNRTNGGFALAERTIPDKSNMMPAAFAHARVPALRAPSLVERRSFWHGPVRPQKAWFGFPRWWLDFCGSTRQGQAHIHRWTIGPSNVVLRRWSPSVMSLSSASSPTEECQVQSSHVFSDVPFSSLGLSQSLVESIETCFGASTATWIQARAIPQICETKDRDFVIGAETGSGKTLTFLVPFIQRMMLEHGDDLSELGGPPRALILVPTAELCGQIFRYIQQFPEKHRVSTAALYGGGIEPGAAFPERKLLIVSTPGALRRKTSPQALRRCEYIVVDEADMLLEGGFQKDVEGIINTLRPVITRKMRLQMTKEGDPESVAPSSSSPIQRQFLFVGATYPDWVGSKVKSVVKYLEKRFPTAISIKTSSLHRSHPHLRQRWLFCDSNGEELALLREQLATFLGDPFRIMIFASTGQRCDLIEEQLRSDVSLNGVQLITVHKSVALEDRMKALDQFQEACASPQQIIVSTDLASRGLDFGRLSHVIQFDFADNVTQHVHRVGRLARASSYEGDFLVINIVQPDRRDLASEIQRLEQSGKPLAQVFSRRRGFRRKMKKLASEETGS
mmetsp:Transcript_3672/g.7031  ORF Transcript_3672/g.7031 Transcript_3672/m.7031 type:complete len:564 (-) Transcript_3672:340-2031(-)